MNMNMYLIGEYVKRIRKDDIYNYGVKEGIFLEDYEIDIIYSYIKNYYRDVINGNVKDILEDIKDKVKVSTYNKILELYNRYKDKI